MPKSVVLALLLAALAGTAPAQPGPPETPPLAAADAVQDPAPSADAGSEEPDAAPLAAEATTAVAGGEAPAAAPAVHAHSQLLVDAEGPLSLVWNAERHAGALAAREQVLLLEELRDTRGQAAGALGLVTTIPLRQPGHLALGLDDGSVYAATARDGKLHGWRLQDGGVRTYLAAGGPQPDLLFHHPVLHKLLSFNGGAATVTLFDTASEAFEGLLPLGDTPVAVRLGPGGSVMALLPERRELTVIGLRPFRILMRFALPGDCQFPADFDIDPVGQHAFVACGNNAITVFDLRLSNWTVTLVASSSTDELVRVFWDGVRNRVISVTRDGVVAMAAGNSDAVRLLAALPPGSVVDYDPAAGRMVWAAPLEDGSGLRAGITGLQ